MIVIELTEDKFGKAMKDLACMEDKLQEIKELFEHESMEHRKRSMYPYEEEEYRMRNRRSDSYNRYM